MSHSERASCWLLCVLKLAAARIIAIAGSWHQCLQALALGSPFCSMRGFDLTKQNSASAAIHAENSRSVCSTFVSERALVGECAGAENGINCANATTIRKNMLLTMCFVIASPASAHVFLIAMRWLFLEFNLKTCHLPFKNALS